MNQSPGYFGQFYTLDPLGERDYTNTLEIYCDILLMIFRSTFREKVKSTLNNNSFKNQNKINMYLGT
jgi:hypothetical protein